MRMRTRKGPFLPSPICYYLAYIICVPPGDLPAYILTHLRMYVTYITSIVCTGYRSNIERSYTHHICTQGGSVTIWFDGVVIGGDWYSGDLISPAATCAMLYISMEFMIPPVWLGTPLTDISSTTFSPPAFLLHHI